MGKRIFLFLALLIVLLAKKAQSSVDTSIYPPEQLVWLRIHDYQATLPTAILELHASLVSEELNASRGLSEDIQAKTFKAVCSALYRALSEIDSLAKQGQFGDWSFILPTHELRDWYALVVLHDQMREIKNNPHELVGSLLLRKLFEEYVCKLSDDSPPYIIIIDRKRMMEILKAWCTA